MSSLVDEFLEGYIYWVEACEDVRTAYQRWQDSKDPGRALEFERYHAALDHEEHAAAIYSFRTARFSAGRSSDRTLGHPRSGRANGGSR
jgi:hypothetical protein